MNDYIKRDDVLRLFQPTTNPLYDAWTERIKEIPAADVVEVVRCEDCIWHDHEAEEPGMVYCSEMVGGWVKSNFYCADGERRSEWVTIPMGTGSAVTEKNGKSHAVSAGRRK